MMSLPLPLCLAGLLALTVTGCTAGEESRASVTSPIEKSPREPTSETYRELSLGDSRTRPIDGMVMAYVPGGKFVMGSDKDEVDFALDLCRAYDTNCNLRYFDIEQPQHNVLLSSFWIDRTEVSNSQ